jgi:N-acetylglucosaminyldiphosphoundecaprenol N-acetyl-beta-D-mannosaminyltransferase
MSEQKNYSVYLLAAAEGLADPEETTLTLLESFPQLKINGNTFAKDESLEKIINHINETRPEILFVAFGAGRQEKFIFNNLNKLPSVKIAMGVGGAFDFIAGKIVRAPGWMRKVGLEWLWRFFMQPWRWKRILTATIKFSWLIIRKGKKYV